MILWLYDWLCIFLDISFYDCMTGYAAYLTFVVLRVMFRVHLACYKTHILLYLLLYYSINLPSST